MKDSTTIPEHIKKLISGYLSDKLSADELQDLKQWTLQTTENKLYFNEMRHVWALSANKDTIKENLPGLFEKMPQRRIEPVRFWTWRKIVASWLIFIVCSGSAGWYLNDYQQSAIIPNHLATTTIHAKPGALSTVDLPDGTKVWLNGGSTLTYANTFNDQDRMVQLLGEACFEVVTNPDKPFVVKAGNLSVKALGTLFNIKAYPEDQTITTTLVKGKVIIEGKDEQNKEFSIVMKPNEHITYRTNLQLPDEQKHPSPEKTTPTTIHEEIPEPIIKKNNIKPELYTSWKDDLWLIEKQQLGSLAKDFERRYNVRMVFASEKVKDFHFSGTIQRETIEQVMAILQRTMPLKYTFNKDLISIEEDKVLAKEFEMKNR